jgi:AcrR family transcriptional regulator
MRADAQRNLDRLLEAAGTCFAERGIECSVDEIAREAGVGHGTVFRRFPTKDALIEAVIAAELDRLVAHARSALEEGDADVAFEAFFRALADGYATNRALAEGYERCAEELPQKAALRDAAHELVHRAQDQGTLRHDLAPEQIFELVPAASRFPDVILDGLRSAAWSDLS